MIIEDIVEFLAAVAPFKFLSTADLEMIVKDISMEFYPKNTLILRQKGQASEYLRVIKKGAVKVYRNSESGDEVVIDYRGEGDTFGLISLMSQDRQKTNVLAVEDTICYLIGKEKVFHLLDTNPSFTEYFLKSHLTTYIDKTYDEMHERSMLGGSTDRLLFTTRVGEIASGDVKTTDEETSIREAAREMAREKVSSLVVLDGNGLPVGIVTDKDLREKVVARDRDAEEPVKNIISLPMIRVDAGDFCFEAVLKMIKYNIHHLLVIKDGALAGILTNHDLMLLQGTSPLSFAREIENQITVDGLQSVAGRINNIVGLLLKDGARAGSIMRIISEINDRLVRKLLSITEARFGRPPVSYCWLALGSDGRREQTFKTDQDNAIIYSDPPSGIDPEEVRRYFAGFSGFVKDGLLKCGFPPCPNGFMASEEQWRRPLKTWKRYFSSWIADPEPEAVLNSFIFFDFRAIHGDLELAGELREHLVSALDGQRVFLGRMASRIIKNRPPIGFFRSFVVEKSGEHRNELNLKLKGIAPIVDAVRLFALERGIRETSTLERIKALKEKDAIVRDYADELEFAFDFIMLLRINLQYEQIKKGERPGDFVNPNNLGNLEKKTMKSYFRLVSEIQDLISERYKR